MRNGKYRYQGILCEMAFRQNRFPNLFPPANPHVTPLLRLPTASIRIYFFKKSDTKKPGNLRRRILSYPRYITLL